VRALEGLAQEFPGNEALADLLYPRVANLILYQSPRYARRYLDFVRRIVDTEHQRTPGRTELGEAVARWLFKLMAYKDEYEVSRLWLQDPTRERVRDFYDGPLTEYIHLHPPLLRALGMRNKLRLNVNAILPLFRLLYSLRRLRGTPLDMFGRAGIRREERRLIGWYEDLVDGLLPTLTHENHGLAVSIANAPDGIRGYESIKERMIAETEAQVEELRAAYGQAETPRKAG
jgi:indolepyruvate ferredoxin oxidoreductase